MTINGTTLPDNVTLVREIPVLTLSNNVRVCNFSSPHAFVFEDGRVLPALSADDSRALSMESVEIDVGSKRGSPTFVNIRFKLTEPVNRRIRFITRLMEEGHVDVCIVPRPVLDLLEDFCPDLNHNSASGGGWAFATVRMVDRVDKRASISTFCV
jgi:hypothetical protein